MTTTARIEKSHCEPAKIGIYGGSFNPVHFGHIGLAKWVVENTDIDELWLMVSPNNPLKSSTVLAPEQERFVAVQDAVKDIPHVVVSDFEFSLPRPSYTANTLRALQEAYPECEFTLVIGEDNLVIFKQWREYEFILANFRIFVYPRHSKEGGQYSVCDNQQLLKKEIRYLSNAPYFDISSTQLRKKRQ